MEYRVQYNIVNIFLQVGLKFRLSVKDMNITIIMVFLTLPLVGNDAGIELRLTNKTRIRRYCETFEIMKSHGS